MRAVAQGVGHVFVDRDQQIVFAVEVMIDETARDFRFFDHLIDGEGGNPTSRYAADGRLYKEAPPHFRGFADVARFLVGFASTCSAFSHISSLAGMLCPGKGPKSRLN